MKKISSMAALALIMAGCSNDEETPEINPGEVTNAVPVQISQKVAGVETKAAVTLGSEMTANIIMVDAGSGSTDSPDFSAFSPITANTFGDAASGGGKELKTDAARANVATATFKADANATGIKLNPTLYYPVSDKSKKTWILGVAPQGVVDQTKVNFNDVDGLQDVMYATKIEGTGQNASTKIDLEFKHQTTQLLFVAKFVAGTDLSTTEWKGKTVSVTSIEIPNAQVPNAINIKDGTLECIEKKLTVAGCKEALKETACAKSVPVMIKASSSLVVNLVLKVGDETVTYSNLEVKKAQGTESLVTVAGKSHLITFEITAPVGSDQAQVGATAKVVDWTVGDEGKVEIK